MGVLGAAECDARQSILLDHYAGTVEIEASDTCCFSICLPSGRRHDDPVGRR